MGNILILVGLSFTLIGAGLLFFYGLPKKKIGNVIIYGIQSMKVPPDPGERDIPPEKWQPEADKFINRSVSLNRSGFGLIVIGTLLQMFGVCVSASGT